MFFKQRRWIVDDSRNILGGRFFDEWGKKQQDVKRKGMGIFVVEDGNPRIMGRLVREKVWERAGGNWGRTK